MKTPILESFFYPISTPLGTLIGVERGERLSHLFFPVLTGIDYFSVSDLLLADSFATHSPLHSTLRIFRRRTPLFTQVQEELDAYFLGTRTVFDLPLFPQGTPFQESVWRALGEIPWGQTRSYGEIAAAVGKPKAVRAVGGAVHRNPIAIIIPCHRVIGQDGNLTGFACGLDKKIALLETEKFKIRRGQKAGEFFLRRNEEKASLKR